MPNALHILIFIFPAVPLYSQIPDYPLKVTLMDMQNNGENVLTVKHVTFTLTETCRFHGNMPTKWTGHYLYRYQHILMRTDCKWEHFSIVIKHWWVVWDISATYLWLPDCGKPWVTGKGWSHQLLQEQTGTGWSFLHACSKNKNTSRQRKEDI